MKTICAIATAPGGALGVVRVSGPSAIQAVDSIFRPSGGCALGGRPAGTLTLGYVYSPEAGADIDQVVVSLFRAPRSYTGEDCVEISCHGSSYILSQVLALLTRHPDVRLARGGEFTQRAFLAGKMDLSQAEAVADLIASDSEGTHRMALRQLEGALGSRLAQLREQMVEACALLELELDFSDHEDIQLSDRGQLARLLSQLLARVRQLSESFALGQAMKDGVMVTLAGQPNAGKSTLLNALLGRERALVSSQPGTTRDTVEETLQLDAHTRLRLVDTAGLRMPSATVDPVEQMGIERAQAMIRRAQILLWVIDGSDPASVSHAARSGAGTPYASPVDTARGGASTPRTLAVINKADLCTPARLEELRRALTAGGIHADCQLTLSAKTGEGLPRLLEALRRLSPLSGDTSRRLIVSNARHHEALLQAESCLGSALRGLQSHTPSDLIAEDLRAASAHLSAITGNEITSETVLHTIFSRFCVGK